MDMRKRLGEILDAASAGERILIERDHRPLAYLVSVEEGSASARSDEERRQLDVWRHSIDSRRSRQRWRSSTRGSRAMARRDADGGSHGPRSRATDPERRARGSRERPSTGRSSMLRSGSPLVRREPIERGSAPWRRRWTERGRASSCQRISGSRSCQRAQPTPSMEWRHATFAAIHELDDLELETVDPDRPLLLSDHRSTWSGSD